MAKLRFTLGVFVGLIPGFVGGALTVYPGIVQETVDSWRGTVREATDQLAWTQVETCSLNGRTAAMQTHNFARMSSRKIALTFKGPGMERPVRHVYTPSWGMQKQKTFEARIWAMGQAYCQRGAVPVAPR